LLPFLLGTRDFANEFVGRVIICWKWSNLFCVGNEGGPPTIEVAFEYTVKV